MPRQFEEFTDANGTVVSYHVVDAESIENNGGDVIVVGGTQQKLVPGNVLVSTDRPDVFTVVADTDALGIPDAPEPEGIGFVEDDDEEPVA